MSNICIRIIMIVIHNKTFSHRMDSFVLSETFKYLYLLFAKPSDLIIDMDQFIFTTEAHLLPLSLARLSNLTVVPVSIDKKNIVNI